MRGLAKFREAVAAPVMLALILGQLLVVAPTKAHADGDQLEAIGTLTAGHMYLSFVYIGVCADSLVKKVYTGDQVQQMMNELTGSLDVTTKVLTKVTMGKIDETDKKYLAEVIEVYTLLQQEAKHLGSYAKSEKKEDLEQWNAVRNEAWPKMKKLLRIN